MNIIVIDCRMINASGIGRYLRELLPKIFTSVHSEFILLGRKIELQYYLNSFSNVSQLEFGDNIYSISEQISYSKIIPKCDLFWSPHFNVPFFSIKAKKRLVTIHDAYHLAFGKQLSLKERLYAKIFYNVALSKSNKIVTVSNFSKNELIKYTSKKYETKIQTIYNGVEQFGVIDKNFLYGDHYLLFVGNVKPHKNLKGALLGYLAYLKETKHNTTTPIVKFVIVGKKEGFINGDNEISSIVSNNPFLQENVLFTGFVDDIKLANLYAHAIGFIFPSLYEGFGLPPLEAMSYETPVICSNSACMPEICGDAVLYFNPKDPLSLVSPIKEIINSPAIRENLVAKGKERVKLFCWNKSALSHIETIEKLL